MKRSKKQLPSKTNSRTFCNLIALLLGQNSVKGLRVTTIVKEIKFEGVWSELEAKICFQRESFTKYMRLTLVFMQNSALRKSLISVFQKFFATINKIFILAGRLGTKLLFCEFLRLS